jgi:hypothetical protein
MAIFVTYCPLYWGYGRIYMARETQYMLERHELSMDFVSQEHGVPRDGPKDSNAGG